MDLDVLTRLTSNRRLLAEPADARLAGLRVHRVGVNRIDPPGGQDLHRAGNRLHHLTWIAAGQVLVREPGPQRLAGAGDLLVLPAGTTHSYVSTSVRGWRALFIVFSCPDFASLGLPPGAMRPSAAAARALAALASQAAIPGGSGLRLAAALATALAELADSVPLRRSEIAADRLAERMRADPLRSWDLRQQAGELGVSCSALRQALRRRTGLAPGRLRRSLRLAAGARALSAGATVGEAAASAGFSDPFHFSRLFRRAYGVAPRDWRELGG